MGKRKRVIPPIPEWIEAGRRATLIYDILAAPYEIKCDCKTCILIRENEEWLGSLFRPPTPPTRR